MSEYDPIVLRESGCDEGWNDDLRGRVQWRTLFGAEQTPTGAVTAGVAEIMPGDQLKPHRHAPPELYYVLDGSGALSVDGVLHDLNVGTAAFIPSDAVHSVQNTGETKLRLFYVLAVEKFNKVEFEFTA